MRTGRSIIAMLAVLLTAQLLSIAGSRPACAATAPVTTIVLVPGGTSVPVHVVGEVSSGKLHDGDTFQIQAADNVVINGLIVVRKGAEGQGTIAAVDHAGGNGHSGTLELNFDWLYAVDGGKIKLSPAKQQQAEADRKGASSTATIVGIATLGIGGLFGHNLAHGREVTIDERKVLTAFVADNVHVEASERAADVDHFDH